MKIDAPRIKSWVERIEKLLEERTGLNADIRDIYLEIKKGDHDAKAIRKLIQRRAQDEGELAEQDALLAAYTDAVAGKIKALEAIAAGASVREAAKAGGISTGSAGALASVQKSRSADAHTETPGSGSPAGDGEERAVNEAASGLPVTDPTPKERVAALNALLAAGMIEEANRLFEAGDDLAFPPHLDRRAQVRA